MTASNDSSDFRVMAHLLSSSSPSTVPSSSFDSASLFAMTRKAVKSRAPELMIEALDGGAPADALEFIKGFLNQGALSKPVAVQGGRTPLHALVDRFTPERADLLRTSIRTVVDYSVLSEIGVHLLAKTPDHPALAWLFGVMFPGDIATRLALPPTDRSGFWQSGPLQLWDTLFNALDKLADTDPSGFALACQTAGAGLRHMLDVDAGLSADHLHWGRHEKDTGFVSFRQFTAFERALRSESPVVLDAVLRSPIASVFMGSAFRGRYGESADDCRAFSLFNVPGSLPLSSFRFLFSHLANHPDPAIPAAFAAATSDAIANGRHSFRTNASATRLPSGSITKEALSDLLGASCAVQLGDMLHDCVFSPSNFKEHALLTNVNLIQAMLSTSESAKTVFDVWDKHPHAPLALFSAFRPTGAAALFLAHKDVLSSWRSSNGSTALHFALAAMTPFEASRQSILAVLEACPDLADVRNDAGQKPETLIVDSEIRAAVANRMLRRIIPAQVKTAAKSAATNPDRQRRM